MSVEARLKSLERRVLRLEGKAVKPQPVERPRSYVFVRQTRWVPADMAERFGAVIVYTRTDNDGRIGKPNRQADYWRECAKRGVTLCSWDWMIRPSKWRTGLRDTVAWAAEHGASAHCLNVEPHREDLRDWRRRDREAVEYAAEARDVCDEHGLDLLFTSWSLPSKERTFPWRPFCTQADACIVQPYGVHVPSSLAYTQQSIDEYKAQGARRVIVGRGAHEFYTNNEGKRRSRWRQPATVQEHRTHTPEGYEEAWWLLKGKPAPALVDAMVAPLS